jgi:predicted Zn-ribbon and HTH transcriptional regulator
MGSGRKQGKEQVKQKSKEPFVPAERHETVRREIVERLAGQTLSPKDISAAVHISVKEVYEHLEHIRRSLIKRERHLTIMPAECKKCGFIFKKRERLTRPGKCPVCRSETIEEPLFSLGERSI